MNLDNHDGGVNLKWCIDQLEEEREEKRRKTRFASAGSPVNILDINIVPKEPFVKKDFSTKIEKGAKREPKLGVVKPEPKVTSVHLFNLS